MKITSLFLGLLLAATPAWTLGQTAEASSPVITVTGNAQIEAAPDEATVRLGVVQQDATAETAQDQANAVAQAIIDAMAALGIPAQRIQTSRLTLTPVYAPRFGNTPEPPRIVAYSAAHIISIDVTDLAQTGPVIDAGLRAGANQLEGVRFRLKNDLAVREQALKQAVADARAKAEAIAEALGVQLLGVVEVSEGGVSVMPRQDMMMAARAAEMTATPLAPGEIDVHASVTVRYRF